MLPTLSSSLHSQLLAKTLKRIKVVEHVDKQSQDPGKLIRLSEKLAYFTEKRKKAKEMLKEFVQEKI